MQEQGEQATCGVRSAVFVTTDNRWDGAEKPVTG